MKGIIIKDMEMPKACTWYDNNEDYHECPFLFYEGICAASSERVEDMPDNIKPDSCPLRYFEIPTE